MDKESLATYVHRFKQEASRCKFINDAATIRIFLKGLKNAHTIVTKVYEKGPQNLAEAIKEVEKLQLPHFYPLHWSIPCPVIMTGIFNVKTLAIWHTISPIYGASTAINTDMLPWTALIKYHHQAHQHAAEVTPLIGMIGPPLGIIVTPDILTVITKIGQV